MNPYLSFKIQPTQTNISTFEEIIALDGEHAYLTTPASLYSSPEEINKNSIFKNAKIPSVLSSIDDTKEQNASDQQDHWVKISFSQHKRKAKRTLLKLEGLLTICDVYLNHHHILRSTNAYHTHFIDVTALLEKSNLLFLCFRAIQPLISAKHPRPKYITRFVNERNLRFFRTPVIGYTPGFSASNKLIGPYRPIRLIHQNQYALISSFVSASLIDNTTGKLSIKLELAYFDQTPPMTQLIVIDGENQQEILRKPLTGMQSEANVYTFLVDEIFIKEIKAYWPHTHGNPKRYKIAVEIMGGSIQLGHYGFRKIECFKHEGQLSLHYNDCPIYLRGACWTPIDPTLKNDNDVLRARLEFLRDAGINMLRVPGNMPYEVDIFYELCDELGILIYQDFAFTNFDYPENDAAFINSIRQEASQFLSKHGGRANLTALSGGSEVYQQACMMGLKLEEIDNTIFSHHLAEIAEELAPNVPYFISSPYSKNNVPMHSGDGPCNYHGVGGYKRSFEDARLFKGRVIIECLPFSHIPEDQSLRKLWGGKIPETHSSTWKDAVPRDPGSGWDFSDITDYYLETIFSIDVVKLRSIDQERYFKYARAALVEAVETTLSIFRADAKEGRVALVWNLHDFKAGAGWGYLDLLGIPKSAFYALARTSAPTTAIFVDEGLDGLAIYLAHDGSTALNCLAIITLYTEDGRVFEKNQQTLTLLPRSVQRIGVDYFLGRFVDSSYAYKFGARQFIACDIALFDESNRLITHKTYAQAEVTHTISNKLALSAIVKEINDTEYQVLISSNEPAFYVVVDIDDFIPSDNYFHLMPNTEKQITLKPINTTSMPRGRVYALNTKNSFTVKTYNPAP